MEDIFDENERYTPRALAIHNELHKAVQEVFDRNEDISPRLMALLGHHAVTDVELESVLVKHPKKCVRCGKTRKDHAGFELFCKGDEQGRTFVYPKKK